LFLMAVGSSSSDTSEPPSSVVNTVRCVPVTATNLTLHSNGIRNEVLAAAAVVLKVSDDDVALRPNEDKQLTDTNGPVVSTSKSNAELLPFECEVCGKRLERARTLMLHKRAVHEGYRPFACEFCDFRFTQKGHLKQHIEAVHKDEKTCDCSVCGAPFRTEAELANHRLSTHELKRLFHCDLCDKNFTQANKLLIHKSTVHEGKRPFVCDVCGSTFTQLVHLKLHKETIHEG
uniref:Protein krueppel n=1 Tax=Echinostoma caproni TaxID=27848 RepID=A0A183AT95_9TREM